jgi:hypothetical protein
MQPGTLPGTEGGIFPMEQASDVARTANPSHLSDPTSWTSAATSTPLAQLHVPYLGSPPEQPVVGLASADISSMSLEEDQDNLFSSAEFTKPINLAVAAKDLKLAGYTDLEILATLDEFKRSGNPYVPGSPPWTPKLPVNLHDAALDMQQGGYSVQEIDSCIKDFKLSGVPYVDGSLQGSVIGLLPAIS